MSNEIFKASPAVFSVGEDYQIMVYVNCETLMWVKVGNENYYDEANGVLRSKVSIHRMVVPAEELDKAGKYTICFRKVIERKAYFTECEDEQQITFEFKPVKTTGARAFCIADVHNKEKGPLKALKNYEARYGKIDFLIMDGDVPEDGGSVENLETIYKIADKATGGNIPIVFARGNHDSRGIYAENIAEYIPSQNLNTYYTFRLGSIWGMVLDCGEDKDDSHEAYGHTVCFHSFRKRQTKFIEKVIKDAENEYKASGIDHKIIVVHNPFTRQLKPPFDIEKEIFSEWAKLLKDYIKPDVMICGHLHTAEINEPGCEFDHLGQPCTLVVGAGPYFDTDYYAGAGFCFEKSRIDVTFSDSDNEVLKEYILIRENKVFINNKISLEDINTEDDNFVEEIKSYLLDNIYENLTLGDICNHFNVSKSYLCHIFKTKTDKSVIGFYIELKIEAAKTEIRKGKLNITEISEKLGYASIHHFTRSFKNKTGMSPSIYEKTIKE